jgi:hypothetical protein
MVRSIVNRRNGGVITAAALAGQLYRNPTVRSVARNGYNAASRVVQRAWRGRKQARRNQFSSRRPYSRAKTTSYSGIPSKSYSGKRKRLSSGKKYSKKRKGSTLMSSLWKMTATPMNIKNTVAYNKSGIQGQRAYYSQPICSMADLKVMQSMKPTNFLTSALVEYGKKNAKLCVSRCVKTFSVQNRSNAHMELKIYECLVRKDCTATEYNTTSGAFESNASVMRNADYNEAPTDPALPTGVSNWVQYPTFTPYMSSNFCRIFKIVGQSSHIIAPNDYFRKSYSQRRYVIEGEKINDSAQEWIGKFSKVILFSWVGQPCDDGTLANQSKATCDLFLQINTDFKFYWAPRASNLFRIEAGSAAIDGDSTSTYKVNPAAFTSVIGVDQVVQTVSGSSTVTETHP